MSSIVLVQTNPCARTSHLHRWRDGACEMRDCASGGLRWSNVRLLVTSSPTSGQSSSSRLGSEGITTQEDADVSISKVSWCRWICSSPDNRLRSHRCRQRQWKRLCNPRYVRRRARRPQADGTLIFPVLGPVTGQQTWSIQVSADVHTAARSSSRRCRIGHSL